MKPSIPTLVNGRQQSQTRAIRKPSSPSHFPATLQLASRHKRTAKLFGFFAAMLVTLQSVMASYTVTLEGSGSYNPVGIHLDNPAGNDLNTLFPGASDSDSIFLWDCTTQDFAPTVPTYIAGMGQWIPNLTLTPGQGVFYVNQGATRTATLNGNPITPVYPPSQDCGCDKRSMLANQTATVASWGSLMGAPPINGSQFIKFDLIFFDWVTNKYDNCAWTLGEPAAAVGEAVWVVVPCTNSTPCLPCTNNLVINGSFENPNIGANTVAQLSSIPGWTAIGPGGPTTLEIWSGNFFSMTPQDGNQHLELNSLTNNVTVSQVITNASTNCTAKLCFWYAGRASHTPNNFQFQILGSGLAPVNFNPPSYTGPSSWQQYCVEFTPVSTTVTIRFTGTSGAALAGAHIDNVSLMQCCTNPPCINPVTVNCSTNKTVGCSESWSFDAPIITEAGGGTNYTVSFTTSTNVPCPFAEYIRIWTIIDACGNTNVCSQIVTVTNPAPLLLCATNKSIPCGTPLTFDLPIVTNGSCSNTFTMLNTYTNGNCPTVVTRSWLVSNPCGFSNFCSQSISIFDTVPPVINCQPNKSINCGSALVFDTPTASDSCSGSAVTVTVLSTVTNGGCTKVITRTWRATDACNNASTCTQSITINPATPSMLCTTNKTVPCGSVWTFDTPTLLNPGCATMNVLTTYTNGTDCSKQITRIWQAVNPCGSSINCTQIVTVVDSLAPVFNCPGNKTVPCGSAWQFDTASATDNCGGAITPSIFATFTNGACPKVATRIWQAVDSCGNSTTCTQLVTMADTVAPVLCCPNDITITTCSNSAIVNFKVKVTDNCTAGLVAVCIPPSGSLFPVGTTTVTCTATDACGNVGTCSFKVTVKAGETKTKTITIGNVDCFSTTNKDYTPRSPALSSLGALSVFDASPFPGKFGASFLGLPTSISCARLEIRMRPYGGNTNTAYYDKIALGLTNTSGGGQFAWTNNIGNQGSGGGLIGQDWGFGASGACGRTFYINLSSLPNGGQNLIPLMSSSHKLDILVRSNTFVDYARLCYCYCASKPVWKGFEWDLSNMTLYRACDDIIIVKGNGSGTATFGSAVGQTAGVSLGFEPISFVSAVDGLTFRGQRVSGASPNLATVSGDGAGGMEFRSTAVRSNVTQLQVTLYNGNTAVSQSTLAWSPSSLIANTAAGAKLIRASVSDNGDKQTFKLEAPVLMGISSNAPAVADSIAIKFVGAQDVAGDMIEGYFFDTEVQTEIALNDSSVQTGTLETRVTGDAITAVSGDTTTVTSTEQSTNSVTGLTLPVSTKPILIGPVLDGCNGWIIDRRLDVKLVNVGLVKLTGVSNTWDVDCSFPVINSTNGVRFQVLNAGTVLADSGATPVTSANVSGLPSQWSFSTDATQGIVRMNWEETAQFTINGSLALGDELRLIPLGSGLPAPVFSTMTIESVGIEAITVSSPTAAGPWTLLPLQLSGNSVTIQWTGPNGGILESAPTVLGPWTTVPNQTEFLTIKPRTTALAEFFRVRSND